ncbi:hypothetical protein GGR28_000248 [Lewinella aquimaris]|uniref:Glycosyltransferase RgtA/B/C/D-like domain-containing protein n=1 Tax=Neolewinella aquimaris TaxID=1835722 RepID=A0A840E3K5_9BACT|nr:hypothetical protein [Neolewinella aquimaris]MBB4077647.1 hypothetical protein [Neolewinella aquimaris]
MKANVVVLIVAFLALVLHHAFFFYGHFGFDDLHYARLAHDLTSGVFDPDNPYSYRILPLALIALSYSVFGVNDLASALPALLCSGGILYLFYLTFRGEAWWKLLLCIGFYFGMKWNVFYSDKLMPDIFVSGFAFAGWVAYERGRQLPSFGRWAGVLAALALFAAFNAKGTIILLAPIFLGYFLWDVLSKRWMFWRNFLVVTSVLLGAYLLVIYSFTGSPFSRFTAITSNHYLNPCSYDSLPWATLIDRWTTGFWQLFTGAGLLIHLAVAVVTLVVLRYRRSANARNLFYPLTVVLGLLSVNFMTISLTSYNPICLDPRHILLFSPIFAVCSVRSLSLLTGFRRIATNSSTFLLAIGLLLTGLCTPTVQQAIYGRTLEYAEVKRSFQQLIGEAPKGSVLYGSEVTRNLGDYFNGFQTGSPVFRNVADLPKCATEVTDDQTYLVRNWYADWHASHGSGELAKRVQEQEYRLVPTPLTTDRIGVERIACP